MQAGTPLALRGWRNSARETGQGETIQENPQEAAVMTARWFWIMVLVPWLGGCGSTTIVTPALTLGANVVTLTTNINPDVIETSGQAAEQTEANAIGLGLRSTIRF
jgi:hypothetical protein